MHRLAVAAVAIVAGSLALQAQNVDVIKQRREAMRTIATANSAMYKMLKGDQPFDLTTVQAALKTYGEQGQKFRGLFPDDSMTGGDTGAQPKIWTSKAEFDGIIDKWIADAKAASGTIKDAASFNADFPKVADACGSCHKAADGFSIGLRDAFKKMKDPL